MKTATYLGLLIGYAFVEAFTTPSIKLSRKASTAKFTPVFYTSFREEIPDETQRQPTNKNFREAELVGKIRQCGSLDGVNLLLKRAAAEGETASERLTPNVAAAAFLRSTQLSSRQIVKRDPGTLIWSLLQQVERLMSDPATMAAFSLYALVDTFSALAILKRKLRFGDIAQPEAEADTRTQNLGMLVLEQMDHHKEELLLVLRPFRMVDTLHALHVLGFGKANAAAERIHNDLCRKLTGGHALSVLSPGDMSVALTTLAATTQPFHENESKLAVGLMRRFRKQAVRQSANKGQLLQAIRAATRIGVSAKELADLKLFKEAQLMVFTVFKEMLSQSTEQAPDNTQTKNMIRMERPVKLPQISEMLRCLSSMDVLEKQSAHKSASASTTTALQSLWGSYLDTTSQEALSHASVDEMSRFLWALEETHSQELSLPPHFSKCFGEHFYDKVMAHEDGQKKMEIVDPKSVNTMLRFAALQWARNDAVLAPFWGCAQDLFSNEIFLAGCSGIELTNFMTFAAKTKHHDGAIGRGEATTSQMGSLLPITGRILDPEISDSLSPAQASRILSSFASVVAERSDHDKDGPSETYMNATRHLFHTLGGHFLTANSEELSPRDISDALGAYAKANYAQDMGIFDHLTSLMAARLDDCSIRQVAQSLWACGKMTVWELKEQSRDVKDSFLRPPYLTSANQFAAFLLQNQDAMTPKDVAQSVWALARLQDMQHPDDEEPDECLDDFVWRAQMLAPQLTLQEVANVLWGMSRIGYSDCGPVVQPFTDRILHLHTLPGAKSTPQDASNIMLALGRMGIREKDVFEVEEVFEILSDDILDQLDVASAQAIANAMWAHNAVSITPPRQLLDRWAIERLGLVAVQLQEQPEVPDKGNGE